MEQNAINPPTPDLKLVRRVRFPGKEEHRGLWGGGSSKGFPVGASALTHFMVFCGVVEACLRAVDGRGLAVQCFAAGEVPVLMARA